MHQKYQNNQLKDDKMLHRAKGELQSQVHHCKISHIHITCSHLTMKKIKVSFYCWMKRVQHITAGIKTILKKQKKPVVQYLPDNVLMLSTPPL